MIFSGYRMTNSLLFVHEDHANRNGHEEEEYSDDDTDDGADVGLVFTIVFGLFRAVNIRYLWGNSDDIHFVA